MSCRTVHTGGCEQVSKEILDVTEGGEEVLIVEQTEELMTEDTVLMPRSSPDGSAVADIDNEQYGSLLHMLFFLEILFMNCGLEYNFKQSFSSNTKQQYKILAHVASRLCS